ncbi:MAG: anion permease, partial [Bacteroidota bacterium]
MQTMQNLSEITVAKNGPSTFEKWMKITGVTVAFIIFAIIFTMGTPIKMTMQGKASLAVFCMAFVLWVSQAIPTYASALLAIIALVFTGGWNQDSALAVFGQDIIWLM